MILDQSFYQRKRVDLIARQLLGKVLVTQIDGKITSGRIVETEAYSHKEKGCHAFDNRMTESNKVMFMEGGHAYVYLCYGIHYLFNVVTNREGIGDAVLIRALEPIQGLDSMCARLASTSSMKRITSGPGKLSKAMGITKGINGARLGGGNVWIENEKAVKESLIVSSPRIGIDYAGEDAKLPWRFTERNNPWISKT
jgi:DNA-3-methyladenine glycosylase